MQLPPVPQSTYCPNHQPQRDSASGFTALNAPRPREIRHRLHRTTLAPNPSSPRCCNHGGPRPNPSRRYLGRPRRARFLLSAANNDHLRRRPCRAAFCAPTRTRLVPVPSNRRGHSAASSLWSSRASGSTNLERKKSSMIMRKLAHTSSGAPERTRTRTRSPRFRHQANVPLITALFSSA